MMMKESDEKESVVLMPELNFVNHPSPSRFRLYPQQRSQGLEEYLLYRATLRQRHHLAEE
jgi:hypothetical protein